MSLAKMAPSSSQENVEQKSPLISEILQSHAASFRRYTDLKESEYLYKVAKNDAWRNLSQWFFPAFILAGLSVAYWIYRYRLEILLQGTDNPREFSVFIAFVFKFFVVLLHIALVAYLFQLQRILRHFGKHGTNGLSSTSSESKSASQNACNHPTTIDYGKPMAKSSFAIYHIEASPRSALSLVLTSRSGLRRYRWHYYLGDIPLTPLPPQRKILPLYVQKKSWEDLTKANLGQLAEMFPTRGWLDLCQDCQRLDCQLCAEIVEVQYCDFHFYYLCALDPVPIENNENNRKFPVTEGTTREPKSRSAEFSSLAKLLEHGSIASADQPYYIASH